MFDDEAATEDIIDWIKEVVVDRYDYHESEINLLLEKIDIRNHPYIDINATKMSVMI